MDDKEQTILLLLNSVDESVNFVENDFGRLVSYNTGSFSKDFFSQGAVN